MRRTRQLTQAQLAEAANLSVDFISLIERGRNAPSFDTIERLAEALDTPICQLFWFGPDDYSTLSSIQVCCPMAGKRSWLPNISTPTVEQLKLLYSC